MIMVSTMAKLLGECTVALARLSERLFAPRTTTFHFRRLTFSSSAAATVTLNQDSSFLVYF
ncbi:hypothetical protein PTKIN_Ptkin04bG0158300 [Pterospermum kingtungense]